MNGARGDSCAQQACPDVHDAAGIARCDQRRTDVRDFGELGCEDVLRELRLNQAVNAGAAATLIGVRERCDLERRNRGEDRERLSREALSVEEMAGCVVRNPPWYRSTGCGTGVGEKLAHVAGARGDGGGALGPRGIIGEEVSVLLDHESES